MQELLDIKEELTQKLSEEQTNANSLSQKLVDVKKRLTEADGKVTELQLEIDKARKSTEQVESLQKQVRILENERKPQMLFSTFEIIERNEK